jgi:hypothetical protein
LPSSARDVDAQIPLVADVRLARVQPHADAHLAPVRPGVLAERALCRNGCVDRVAGTGEREEEGISLGIDLGAAGRAERLADEAAMVPRERPERRVAQLLEELRRPFDVRERERDRSRVERAHGATVLDSRPVRLYA